MKDSFKEEKCSLCNEKFDEGDDIVVCPDCGTPYHRSCYKENGSCVNSENHGEFMWKGEKQELYEHCDNMYRAKVQKEQQLRGIDDDQEELLHAGSYDEYIQLMEKQVIKRYEDFGDTDGVTVEELVKFLSKNAKYYMKVFKDIKKNGKILKLNFSSFIMFPIHSFYRRMNLFGTVTMIINMVLLELRILISGAPVLSSVMDDGVRSLVLYLLLGGIFAINLFTFMFFNHFYFKTCIKKIKAIKEEHKNKSHNEILKIIASEGRPSLFSGVAFTCCAGLVCVMAFQLLNNFLGVVV